MKWFYLSFATAEAFRSAAVIIEANDPLHARLLVSAMGINPGGEVLIFEYPPDITPSADFCNRLLSKEDLVKMDPTSKTLREHIRGLDTEIDEANKENADG